jgi:putative aldouronate transport system permease protein
VVGVKRTRAVRSTGSDRLFDIINNTILSVLFILVLYPLIYVVSCSFSSTLAIYSGKVWLFPVGFNVIAYKEILQYRPVLIGYGNTIFYTVVGTAINVVCTLMAAYPLSRRDLVGRKLLMFIFTFTMIFNGGMIPTYLLVRNLGMINTRWAMLIPVAVGVYHVIITRTFFEHTIPQDLLDASRIDGASDIQFIFRVVLPLSGAVIAVITLFYAVMHWNSFFNAFIYLNRRELYPLQIFLREILVMNEIDPDMMIDPDQMQEMEDLRELLKYALIIVSTVPIIAVYPLVQRYFVRGVMLGSIKG